ncbi:ankyrin repeat-containing domain protein [Apiospora arundinis]
MVACRTAKHYAVEILLASGANVSVRDSIGSTALLNACRARDLKSITLLLSRGASVNTENDTGYTPLSAVLGDPDLTRLLLNHGASVSFRNLLKALKKSDLISAELIYDNLYPKPRSVAEIQRMFRVTWESDPAVLGFVLALDKDRVIIQDQRSVSRMLSCARSNPKSVLLLLESGAQCDDVSTPGGGGAIYWAVSHSRNEEFIQKLLAAGANPDMIRTGGQNTCALYEAVSFGDRNKRRTYVKLLVDHGANVNAILDEISNSNAPQQLFGKTFITPFRRSLSSLAHRGVTSIGRFVPNFVDREVVEIMLHSKSMQSWNDELKASYAAEAIQNGSVKLLESLMALGAADVVNQHLIHTALNYELRRLQQISKSPGSFDQMNDSIEMIVFLSRNGADWNYRGKNRCQG